VHAKRRAILVPAPLIAVALVVVGAGCSGGDDKRVSLGEGGRPSASATPSPSFATNDPVQAFLGWFDAVYRAERSLDPNHPGLTKYGQGPALADIRQRIASFRAQGVRLDKPDVVKQPRISGSGRPRGKLVNEVAACVTEPPDNFVDVKSGRPRAPEGADGNGLTSKFVGVMVLMADGWHIDGGHVEDVKSCSAVG